MSVAALYVQPGGAYYGMPGVDAWPEERDARQYAGPSPVVAHPPCQLWVNLTGVNYKRYGGPHNRPGNDGGCFARALAAVRRWGGVLEHPAGSYAWETFGLLRPGSPGWSRDLRPAFGIDEWTCEVWQSAYGHRARKRTWLLFVSRPFLGKRRLDPAYDPVELDWSRPDGTHQVGWFDRAKPTLSKKDASATPPAFRDALLGLARMSRHHRGEP
jgi:hypothetical protein